MIAPKSIVLVVDDEAPIRRFLKAALEGQGYKVVEAATGGEGLALAGSHHPDVILLDLGLPDMDGLVVLKKLREWSQAPVVILSARGKESDKVAGLDAGADDYLRKPFVFGELEARLRVGTDSDVAQIAARHAHHDRGPGFGADAERDRSDVEAEERAHAHGAGLAVG